MKSKPKTFDFKLPVLGYSRLHLGKNTEVSDENNKKYTVYFKLLSDEPENEGDVIKIFTFGIFFLEKASGMRLGFIKRHQILAKAA